MKRVVVPILLVVLLVAFGFGIFFLLFEKREELVEIGPQREARANPFLAAERFLGAMGHQAASHSRFTSDMGLPPTDGLLAILSERTTLSRARHDQILDWVSQGGTLFTVIRHPEDDEEDEDQPMPADPLLEFFGLAVNHSGEDDVMSFDMLDGNTLEVTLTGYLRIEDPNERAFEYFADNGGNLLVLLLSHGEGWVILLNESGFFTNKHIGTTQNAAFFYQLLLLGNKTPSEIWLIFRETYPPLSELLGRYAWMAFVTLGLFILLGIWAYAPRLGPVPPDPAPIRRRLMEHIEAGGHFLWKYRAGENLIRSAREAMIARIRHRHPGWLNMSEKDQRRHLREITGLPAHSVAQALEPDAVADPEHFTKIIGYIEKLRRAL